MGGVIFQYLGQKGAGPEFIKSIQVASNKFNLPNKYLVSSSTDYENRENLIPLNLPRNKLLLYGYSKLVKPIIPKSITENTMPVIGLMAHPFDLKVLEKLRSKNRKIGVVVHDYPPHRGELFPSKEFTRRYIDLSDQIICLSEVVAEQIREITNRKNITILKHPPFTFKLAGSAEFFNSNVNMSNDFRKPRLLIIGRLMPYTGIESFLKQWETTDLNDIYSLRVVGRNAPISSNKFTSIRKWLSHNELIDEIESADGIIFPYTEASQSGLVPLAILFGKVIFYTKVGGIPEQLVDYPKKFILDSNFSVFKSQWDLLRSLSHKQSDRHALLSASIESWKEFILGCYRAIETKS